MSFQFKVTVNGFDFVFGNDFYERVGLFLNFGDPKIIYSIMHGEKDFYDALVAAVEESELWESQHLMEQFERYYLQKKTNMDPCIIITILRHWLHSK